MKLDYIMIVFIREMMWLYVGKFVNQGRSVVCGPSMGLLLRLLRRALAPSRGGRENSERGVMDCQKFVAFAALEPLLPSVIDGCVECLGFYTA